MLHINIHQPRQFAKLAGLFFLGRGMKNGRVSLCNAGVGRQLQIILLQLAAPVCMKGPFYQIEQRQLWRHPAPPL